MVGILATMAAIAPGSDTISLVGGAISESHTGAPAATTNYILTSGGDENKFTTSGGTTTLGQWITNPINASLYEVKATLAAGVLTSGTTGVWLALSSTQTWVVTKGSGSTGTNSANLTIDIRRIGTTTVLATVGVALVSTIT